MSNPQNTLSVATVKVELGDRSYPIYIGAKQLESADIAGFVQGKRVLIVTNKTVAPLYLEALQSRLTGKQVDSLILEDGEQTKNLETLNIICTELLHKGHDRKTTLIALGGGVIGDITGFAAACYQRGVPFIQVPTTLLSQVDSSVGGKTAVNHSLGKNMIGAFYQPRAVIIDTHSLTTLPDREFSAGMAEVIKYGLIADAEFFAWLEENSADLKRREDAAMSYAIEQSCLNKARIVSADETEQGVRAILNLGHTFGHAIETFQQYRGWLHGEAVAAGMLMAARMSLARGGLTQQQFERIEQLIASWSLPVLPPSDMCADDFMALMYRDKKVQDGQLRLVLLSALGTAEVTGDFSEKQLQRTLIDSCSP
ncbi:MAG: 3-dehydroquinate synthase [Porticoccaceae bacterium]